MSEPRDADGDQDGPPIRITDLLEQLHRDTQGREISVGEMVETVEQRGFGPLLLLPALLVLLPTGALPGVPSLGAALVIVVAVQILLGRRWPWLPRQLRQMAIKRSTFEAAYRRALPVVRRIDRLLYPRLQVLVVAPAPRLIALLCLGMAVTMPPLELVPFAAAAPAWVIAFLALGLSARDGVLVIAGLVAAVVASWFIFGVWL